MKAKGVNHTTVKHHMAHKDYKKTLGTGRSMVKQVVNIRSLDHQLYTLVQDKVALSTFYDKFKMINNMENVPYGYNECNATD